MASPAPRVLVTPPTLDRNAGPYFDVLTAAGCKIVYPALDAKLDNPAVLLEHLAGIDAVLCSVEPYTAEILRRSKLRCVARVGVGYDSVDFRAASELGIPVCITPGTNEHSVAEQAFSLIFSVFRDVAVRDGEIRAGLWRRNSVRRLAGNTLGLVGLGRIGKAMVPRARGLGLDVVAFDPYADKAWAAANDVRLCSFDELLAASDVVSLHMPCTAETTNLMNRQSLAKMKPNSVLINTSRGGLIDEEALLEYLTNGHLFGAGLDVLKIEPPRKDHPFFALKNITLAPHMGGIDQTALDAMAKLAAECIVGLSRGRAPEGCVVNSEILTGWKW
ncbi:MAG: phosphoglycerate dehydrogenase [Planctomycetia bacterium]|nr:phosphoglycerate dehydrogenase [Planctomycetia bacterium]